VQFFWPTVYIRGDIANSAKEKKWMERIAVEMHFVHMAAYIAGSFLINLININTDRHGTR